MNNICTASKFAPLTTCHRFIYYHRSPDISVVQSIFWFIQIPSNEPILCLDRALAHSPIEIPVDEALRLQQKKMCKEPRRLNYLSTVQTLLHRFHEYFSDLKDSPARHIQQQRST